MMHQLFLRGVRQEQVYNFQSWRVAERFAWTGEMRAILNSGCPRWQRELTAPLITVVRLLLHAFLKLAETSCLSVGQRTDWRFSQIRYKGLTQAWVRTPLPVLPPFSAAGKEPTLNCLQVLGGRSSIPPSHLSVRELRSGWATNFITCPFLWQTKKDSSTY